MNSPQIDTVDDLRISAVERSHGLEIARQHQSSFAVGVPFRQMGGGFRHGDEPDFDIGGDSHSVELLLPVAGGHLIINQDDQVDAHRPAPSDDYLAVNETVINTAEHDGHSGYPDGLFPGGHRSSGGLLWRQGAMEDEIHQHGE